MEDDFYFESDHLALRGNQDYSALLRVVVLLEAQRVMIIKDVENLCASQKKALEDPAEFVKQLKEGKLEFPPSNYTIPQIPTMNWSNYGISENQMSEWTNTTNNSESNKSNHILVRGRTFDQSKPETFNQLWTFEEQRRLEELLMEFPEEEVEMRRWVKIANALGNRTPKQVMSRVQKYFIKLQQAGLPVPGRIRKLQAKISGHRHQRNNKFYHKKSTFFPSQDVPVLMDEDNPQATERETKVDTSSPEQWTPLELMQAVYEKRQLEKTSNQPTPIHNGIACIGCNCESIVGTRWSDGVGSDWCSDCLIEYQPSTKMTPVTSMHLENDDHNRV